MKFVTKTSRQAQLELEKLLKDSTCPECKTDRNLNTIATKVSFRRTEKMKKYKCSSCKCEWNTGWETVSRGWGL